MSMSIYSNIQSLNVQRRLGQHTKDLRSSFEKLSSGLRVSKASDDAAGLSVSENLKTDSRLASQALRNVNDGISMISIISGALNSQKSILFRMAELAEQSANGTNSQQQRKALQREYFSLQEEFDRVASTSEFNGISLLRNPETKTINLMAGITGADSSLLSVTAANSHRFAGEVAMTTDLNLDGRISGVDVPYVGAFVGGNYTTINETNVTSGAIIQTIDSNGNEVDLRFMLFRFSEDFLNFTPLGATPATLTIVAAASGENGDSWDSGALSMNTTANTLTLSGTLSNSGATFSAKLDLSDVSYTSYENPNDKHRPSNIGFTNIETEGSAKHALVTVKNRIEDLSKVQGSFGAIESRLNFAANRLLVDRENIQSAATQITDIDVATESPNLIKAQILQQAAVSVLAQANQQPQIALQLLKGLK